MWEKRILLIALICILLATTVSGSQESAKTPVVWLVTGACLDTDGGFYPDIQGSVFLNFSYVFKDECFDSANLLERFCVNDTPVWAMVNCPTYGYSVCTDGACATTTTSTTSTTTTTSGGGSGGGGPHHTTTTTTSSTTTTTGVCYDTDSGNWSDIYGILYYNGTLVGDDVCANNLTISERYCNSSHEPAISTYACALDGFDVCQWGMCLYTGETTSTTTTTTSTSTTSTTFYANTTWNGTQWNLPLANAPITGGTCHDQTLADILMLFFIFILILGVLALNELVLRLPVLNLVVAAGLAVFGFTLFWCAWYLAFICWLLAVGVIVLSWGEL